MDLWSKYVKDVAGDATQEAIAGNTGVAQSTVGRWIAEDPKRRKVPTEAATVAAFARAYARNVLEAFVAAGLLTEAQALTGLPEESRRYLQRLRRRTTAPVEAVRARSSRS